MSHVFSLGSISPQRQTAQGSRSDATQLNFPVLKGMALSILKLKPNGYREPHWHPNANELSYCVKGKALMTMFHPGAGHETFIIEPGTLSFVPMGYLHHIQNIGDDELSMLVCFNSEKPEDIDLSNAVHVVPNSIMSGTFSQNLSFFNEFHTNDTSVFIGEFKKQPTTHLEWETNRFKMDIGSVVPPVQNQGGWVKMSNEFLFPSLDGLALYLLQLNSKGIREPHWHPNAHELNIVLKGSAKITLLSPGGAIDTFDMKEGDISFLPKGYFHYIENTASADTQMAVFFSHKSPSDIGLSGCLGAYSNDLLADLFQCPANYLDKFPKYQHDLFVVAGGG
ncbi:MAG: cupin domain-containing protein [Parachlamydiaceae bacterium]|nr:cupin domain-containing protein [Parachlamydiaceae bacterium]